MKLGTLYKRTQTGKVQEWTIEIEGNKYRTISGQTDGKKMVSKWTDCYAKNTGKLNATTNEEQALVEATAKRRLKLEREYTDTIKEVDNFSENVKAVMLAKKYHEHKDSLTFPVFVQPKLDGMRCRVNSKGMFSREGKDIISAPHVYEILKPLFTEFPNLVLDGELYSNKLYNNFDKIISLVKKSKPTDEDLRESAEKVEYHIYDTIVDGNFSERNKILKLLFDKISDKRIIYVETRIAKDEEEIFTYYQKWLDQGYEGLMVRMNTPYETKRTKALLKLKPNEEEEFTIIDIEEGKGNRSGMAGRAILSLNDGSGRTFEASMLGSHDYCVELLKNVHNVRGQKGTVVFQNYSPKGIPRFGRLKIVRDYE
jgi:DNA ligase-1